MSDINHNRMIPLHIADQAVAACEKEIATLKAEVENSNRINTELLLLSNQQASEVRRLTTELSNISGWGRGLESDLSHARVEVSFLKAEVERLTERNKFLEQIDSYLQGANENAYEKRCDELEAEVEELKRMLEASTFGIEFAKEDIKKLEAEVERLRRAGDKMAKTLEKDQQRYNGCPSPEAEMWWIARDGGCP